MPTKEALKLSLNSYKGCNQRLINLLFAQRVEIRSLLRKIKYKKKQIVYLVKKAYPPKSYTPLQQKIILHKYLFSYHARIHCKGKCKRKKQ